MTGKGQMWPPAFWKITGHVGKGPTPTVRRCNAPPSKAVD